MLSFVPLAVLVGVATAVPAGSGWNVWTGNSSTTAMRTSTPTGSITTSTEMRMSTTTSTLTSRNSTSTSARQWASWDNNTVSSTSTVTTSGSPHQWSPPSDPYNLWGDDSTSSTTISPSHTWTDSSSAANGDVSGPLDTWFRQSPAANPSVPTATLLPTVHWSQDGDHLDRVKPQDSATQYYMPDTASPSDAHQFGWLSTNFTNNVVMLDHSTLLDYTYQASTGALIITFSDDRAYSLAQSAWHVNLIMAFYTGACGTANNCFAVCQNLSFDASSKTCTMSTTSAAFEEIASYYTFQWGIYQPTDPVSGDGRESGSCVAPSDNVHGLPTSCLGRSFDQNLDDSYTYVTLDQTDFADTATVFPHLWHDDFGLDSSDYANCDAAQGLAKRMEKRWNLSNLNPFRALQKLADAILLPIKGLTVPYEIPLIDLALPLNAPTSKTLVSSPWGPQVLVKSFQKTINDPDGILGDTASGSTTGTLDIYCVDCGVSGSAKLAGVIGVSVLDGIDYIKTNLDVNMVVGLKLGVVAEFDYNQPLYEPLFVVPLSPLTIGVATVGAYLKAGVELDLNLAARGKILGGGTMTLSNAKVSLDVTSFKGEASGWTPSFEPVFEADGEIAAEADFGVPVAIAIGITALGHSADVSLVERPAIVARAQASASADLHGARFVEVDGCKGISASLDFKNDLYAQFALDSLQKRYNLFNVPEKSLFSTCFLEQSSFSSSTTAVTSSTTTSAAKSTTSSNGSISSASSTASSSITTTLSTMTTAITTLTPGAIPIFGNTTAQTIESFPTAPNIGSTVITTADAAEPTNTNDSQVTGITTMNATSTSNGLRATTPATPGTTDSGTITDTTAQTIANNGTTDNNPFTGPDSNEFTCPSINGYTFASLIDSSTNYQAYSCSNGNIHVFGIDDTISGSDCQKDFTMSSNDDNGQLIVADGDSRLFVYYPDEISATGVSRLRVVDAGNIPKGAEEIVLFPNRVDDSAVDAPVYFPVNQNQEVFYTVMCRYTDTSLYNKLFITSDPDAGLLTLNDPALKYSITGGDVDSCYFIPLIDSANYST